MAIRVTSCKTRHSTYKRRSALRWRKPTCAQASNTTGPSSQTRCFPSSWSTRSAPARSPRRQTTSSCGSWIDAASLVEGTQSGKNLLLGNAVAPIRGGNAGQRSMCLPGAMLSWPALKRPMQGYDVPVHESLCSKLRAFTRALACVEAQPLCAGIR